MFLPRRATQTAPLAQLLLSQFSASHGEDHCFRPGAPRNQSCAMSETIQRIVLASRPVGEPTLDNFRSERLPIPHLGSDEMLLRTLWLSLDPYMRGRMSDAPNLLALAM